MSRFERWSRRKLGSETPDDGDDVTVGEAIEKTPSDDRDTPAGDVSASETDARGEDLAPADPAPGSLDDTLPDPDTLPPGSDIKAFLEPGVSRGLRRRALRRLFSGDKYGIRDGLDDYDHDYREKLKPLAGELAQRMRQWTRPVDPPEEDGVDEALTESPRDTAPVSHEDTSVDPAADKATDEGREPASDAADTPPVEAEAPLASAALDEGRVGARHKNDQD